MTFAKVTERLRQIPFTPLDDQQTHRWVNDNYNNPDPGHRGQSGLVGRETARTLRPVRSERRKRRRKIRNIGKLETSIIRRKSRRLFHSGSKRLGCLHYMAPIVPLSGESRYGTLVARPSERQVMQKLLVVLDRPEP